jgi:phosphoribosylaminoimidazole carboxylase (NCAIR synthetase)
MTPRDKREYHEFLMTHLDFVYAGASNIYYTDIEEERRKIADCAALDPEFDTDAAVRDLLRIEEIQKDLIDFVDIITAEREKFADESLSDMRDEMEENIKRDVLERIKDDLMDY